MKTVVMIPTYNEAGNIRQVIKDILELPMNIEVLVVDDNSPDDTAGLVEVLAANDRRVHLLLRKENRGRGWAGIEGFKEALDMGADFIVEMDGDHSHSPAFIPVFYEKLNNTNTDVVIGSRYISGGKDEYRTLLRRMISGFARKYLAFMLGLNIADPTSGFRMFTRDALQKIVNSLKARDPFIVAEVLFHLKKHGFKITEAPIEFLSRYTGESKLKASTLIKYLFRVWGLIFRRRC